MLSDHPSVVPALLKTVASSEGDSRHLALLALNNLSIPLDNKKALAGKVVLDELLPTLLGVIESDANEAYVIPLHRLSSSPSSPPPPLSLFISSSSSFASSSFRSHPLLFLFFLLLLLFFFFFPATSRP